MLQLQKFSRVSEGKRTVFHGLETISYRALQSWTFLPEEFKQRNTIHLFKSDVRQWICNEIIYIIYIYIYIHISYIYHISIIYIYMYVYELPQSHSGDNRKAHCFHDYIYIYIYIYICLYTVKKRHTTYMPHLTER